MNSTRKQLLQIAQQDTAPGDTCNLMIKCSRLKAGTTSHQQSSHRRTGRRTI